MKKIAILLTLVLCVTLLTVSLAACNKDDGEDLTDATAFVTVDINPSVELTLNAEGKVLSAYGANEDGKVLLYGEAGIVGESVDKAVENITRLAGEMGFLADAAAVVETSVSSDDGNTAELTARVNAGVEAAGRVLGISVKAEAASSFSLLRKLDALKAENPDDENVQALTPEEFKLMLSAAATGEVSLDVAVTLDTEALIDIVSDAHEVLADFATDAYTEAKAAAEAAFEKAKAAALDAVWTGYFTVHRPLDAYTAFAYAGYNASAVAMDALSDVLFFGEKVGEYPLDEARIDAVAALLGFEESDVDMLKNSDGEITLDSIEAYLDKLYRASDLAEDIEALRDDIAAELNTAEAEVKAEIAAFAKEHEAEIAEIKAALEEVAARIAPIADLVPPAVADTVNAIEEDVIFAAEAVAAILNDGTVTSAEVAELSDTLAAKADELYAEMTAELTEDELEEVNALMAKAEETLSRAEAEMQEALAEAEEAARTHLEALKQQLIEKTDNAA